MLLGQDQRRICSSDLFLMCRSDEADKENSMFFFLSHCLLKSVDGEIELLRVIQTEFKQNSLTKAVLSAPIIRRKKVHTQRKRKLGNDTVCL